jgi:hypothetical protein
MLASGSSTTTTNTTTATTMATGTARTTTYSTSSTSPSQPIPVQKKASFVDDHRHPSEAGDCFFFPSKPAGITTRGLAARLAREEQLQQQQHYGGGGSSAILTPGSPPQHQSKPPIAVMMAMGHPTMTSATAATGLLLTDYQPQLPVQMVAKQQQQQQYQATPGQLRYNLRSSVYVLIQFYQYL